MVSDAEMVDLQAEALAAELKKKVQKEPGFAGAVEKAISTLRGYERPGNEGLEHIQRHISKKIEELYPKDPDRGRIEEVAGKLAILEWNGVSAERFRGVLSPGDRE